MQVLHIISDAIPEKLFNEFIIGVELFQLSDSLLLNIFYGILDESKSGLDPKGLEELK